jgi:hypothetical protein
MNLEEYLQANWKSRRRLHLTTNRYLKWEESVMQDQTEDQPVLKHIQRLMSEEQQLHEQGGLADADRERLGKINAELDQC